MKLSKFFIIIKCNDNTGFVGKVKAVNKQSILFTLPLLYEKLGFDKADVKSVEIKEINNGCGEEI